MKTSGLEKRDLILILVILAAALLFAAFSWKRLLPPGTGTAAAVEVSIDGAIVKTLELSKDQTVVIESVTGGSNTLVIENGEAWVIDATCPDKVCEHQGKISLEGQLIVCLPNLMIAKITGE